MKKFLLAAVVLLPLITPAKANLVLTSLTFADLGGTGFGAAPRLLTLQNNTLESGGTIAGPGGTTEFFYGGIPTVPQTPCTNDGNCGVTGGGTKTQTDKSLVYNLATLGWTSGAEVGIGLDTDETGNTTGLTFDTLVLTLYDSAGNVLGSFAGNGPVDISAALLAQQQGNGNSVFNIGLSLAEQTTFNNILAAAGGAGNVFEGLSASFGCGAFGPSVCGLAGNLESSDGPESFLAFRQSAVVPVPAALPLFVTGIGGIGLLGWRRRQRKIA
jgi:hypothetical protein